MLKYFLVLLMSFVAINLQAQAKTTYYVLEEALKNPNLVYRLDLSHQELSQIPPSISQLKWLKRLDLSHNQLTDLSPILDSLKDLRHLYLNDNQLTKLPSKLFQLTKLKKLCLSNNALTELPEDIKNLRKLKCLELRNNRITSLPEELWGLEDINILRFDDPIFLEFVSPFLPNKHPILNWITMDRPDSIGGKPLSFYLNHPNIDPYSKLYVQGKYALDQDRGNCVFIDSIFTENQETAVFYAYLYAVTVEDGLDDFPLFELLYSKRRAFMLEQPCLFMAYYQDYFQGVYQMDEGILDKNKHQQFISELKAYCSFLFENEADLYFQYLNFFLPQSDRKGQIGVRVNDTLEAIEYICLYDSEGKELTDVYTSTYYGSREWFENVLPGKYTLIFYSKEGYKKRKKQLNKQLTNDVDVILRKEVVLRSIHDALVIEIGKAPVFIPRDTLLPLPPPPPPPPSPPVEVSAVSEEFEIVEVIDEETGEIIEIYLDEERPIDSSYIKELAARKETCNRLFSTTRAENLALFLENIYDPVIKKGAVSKETKNFLRAIKQYLEGEVNRRFDKPNLFDFPIIPSYILVDEEASIVLDTENNWSGEPVKLPLRHKEIIRKKVKLYYSNSSIVKNCRISKGNKYNNDCEVWMNYPLLPVNDSLLPAFCSEEDIQLTYGSDTLVDQLLEEKNDCDNLNKICATDENQRSFATLKEVPNLYFTRSRIPYLFARGVYFKTNNQKLVEIWYHEMESEFCGCDH